MFTKIVRLSFVDLRWAQLYVSLVLARCYIANLSLTELQLIACNTSRGSPTRSILTTLAKCSAAWITTIASAWRWDAPFSLITSLNLPGRLLWSNIQGGERNNSGCFQPLTKPITWDCCHLPRIVYQHPKTEVNNNYLYLAVLQCSADTFDNIVMME